MKFEEVKIGDTVFVSETIRYGLNTGKSFILPKKVLRLTKTQFVIDGNRRFRKDGREIGDSFSWALKIGDKKRHSDKDCVSDETTEYNLFKQKIQLEKYIRKSIDKLSISLNSKLTTPELIEVKDMIEIIKKALKP